MRPPEVKYQRAPIRCRHPVRFVDELWEDPQVVANRYIVEYEHSLLGTLRGNAPIVQMSGTPTEVRRAPPALGEHTEEILCEAGFSADDILALRENGAIG